MFGFLWITQFSQMVRSEDLSVSPVQFGSWSCCPVRALTVLDSLGFGEIWLGEWFQGFVMYAVKHPSTTWPRLQKLHKRYSGVMAKLWNLILGMLLILLTEQDCLIRLLYPFCWVQWKKGKETNVCSHLWTQLRICNILQNCLERQMQKRGKTFELCFSDNMWRCLFPAVTFLEICNVLLPVRGYVIKFKCMEGWIKSPNWLEGLLRAHVLIIPRE